MLPDGEEIFYISNPALGLWAFKKKFISERMNEKWAETVPQTVLNPLYYWTHLEL